MKSLSAYAVLLTFFLVAFVRLSYHSDNNLNGVNATSWDAFGYYLYLPATFIYRDVDKLKWVTEIDEKYHVTGGYYYQAVPLENGNYVCKYLGGVALMELPFFALGHVAARLSDYPQDGFSAPYQYAIIWGAVFWFLIGMIVLRKVLLCYYSETVTALTLLLLVAASNLVQYVAVSGSMSHAYIFPLYAFMLYYSMKWSDNPKLKYALAIGLISGVATISRPTELIMLFIPFFWLGTKHGSFKDKWSVLLQNKQHVLLVGIGFFVAILPQLIYWKYVTGSWIYDVGSKWNFHNPWWRVLFGFEKGWFIYTPVTILFVTGLFFIKSKPFRLAVITFCILNIWIIISWHEWRYGASYSTRALTQSYPVFALALAAFTERCLKSKLKLVMLVTASYLIFVNLFQIWQYNNTILHFDHMNAKYYQAIYLDKNPSALDYSLLDTDELIDDSDRKLLKTEFSTNFSKTMLKPESKLTLGSFIPYNVESVEASLKIEPVKGLHTGTILTEAYFENQIIKDKKFRLSLPFSQDGQVNFYQHHFIIPARTDSVVWSLYTFDFIEFSKAEFLIKSLSSQK